MKKRFILSIFCAMLLTSTFAQNQVIKANPLGLLLGFATVSYERAITEKSTFQVNGNYGSISIFGIGYTQAGAGVDYKFYGLSKKQSAPRGFYVAPGIAFSNITVHFGDDKSSITSFILRGVLGHQWIWDSGFSLDLFAGFNYYTNGSITLNQESYNKFSGAIPTMGISLGYAFGGK